MVWRPMAICVLCVTMAACSGGSAGRVDPTIATEPPVTEVAARATVPITEPVTKPTTTVSVTSTTLGPGPSDEEIQAILTDLDEKDLIVFSTFKKTLTITPELDKLIDDYYGPSGDQIRESLMTHVRRRGISIRANASKPVTTLLEVVSRSSECFVVRVRADLSPMLVRDPYLIYELFRQTASGWKLLGPIEDQSALGFSGSPCDIV